MAIEAQLGTFLIVGSLTLVLLAAAISVVVVVSKSRIKLREDRIKLLEKERHLDILTASAKAEERQKIQLASTLHDQTLAIVGIASQKFSAHIMELESGSRNIDLHKLREDMTVFMNLRENITGIIHDIVPELFTSFGLLKSIEVAVKNTNRGSGSFAEFHNNTTFSGEVPFSMDDQLLIYKMCQEILNNLKKYGQYDYLSVSLEEVTDKFVILFSHDGVSITNEEINTLRENSAGMGLKLLESKALLLNASINYTKDNTIAFVRLTVPIKLHEKGN